MSNLDRELTNAIAALDGRENDLARRVGVIEAKVTTNQVEAVAQHGLPADLVATETNAWRRLSPTRNRWPELTRFDERVAELEQRQAQKAEELRELRDREMAAPAADSDRLATWQLEGEEGPRPEPELPAIRREIRQRQEEWEALTRATERVLAEKAEFVERHRGRLTKDADRYADEAQRRYLDLIYQLADARAELAAAQRATVIARLYPSGAAMAEPVDTLAGGRRRALEPMGLGAPVPPRRVFDALRADAEWLREAATPEQKALMGDGRDPRKPPATHWDETDEARDWRRDQRQQALQRQSWGS
jgi:hypothetical protein